MGLKKFQKKVKKLIHNVCGYHGFTRKVKLLINGNALGAEVGEIQSIIKQDAWYGDFSEAMTARMEHELGDAHYHLAEIANLYGVDSEVALEKSIHRAETRNSI